LTFGGLKNAALQGGFDMSSENAPTPVVEINNEQAFTPDPVYKLMGIFADSDAGVAAAEDLKANGFNEADIELFCGVPGEQTYDFSGEDHGLITKLLRSFRNITYDRVIMDRYQAALRDGHCVLMVHIHKDPQKTEAADIMHRYNASQVDYFGLAMTKAFPVEGSEDKYDPDATL
jgi:hypothetical protein